MRKVLLLSAVLLAGCPQDRLRRGLPPEVWVDTHDQQNASQVDVLWVVDNSGSMAPRQENLAKNFQSFIELFSRGSIDFRIAITTTDIFKDAGKLLGTPAVLSPTTPSLIATFEKNVKVGTQGSPYEAGLEAARLAIERQAAAIAPKLDFLRPEAYLYLIFVSDEEDRSSQDIRYYWRSFETAKGIGNDGTVTTAAIIGDVPTNACGATPGSRYLGLSKLTGGEVGSICDSSFASTLRKLATNAVGLRRKFALSKPPNPQTLKVRIRYPCKSPQDTFRSCAEVSQEECKQAPGEARNALCTPPQGGPDGWSYEPENQVIFFAGESVPGLGAMVEIQYYEEGKSP